MFGPGASYSESLCAHAAPPQGLKRPHLNLSGPNPNPTQHPPPQPPTTIARRCDPLRPGRDVDVSLFPFLLEALVEVADM